MKSESPKSSPLSSATLHILLALAGGNLHGYGIIKEVIRNSDGHYRLGPGTLYDNLKKLMDSGLVADAATASSSKRKPVTSTEDDRRFYTLTKSGKNALAAEVDRLQSVVREAKLRLQEARTGKA
ncbi:MAG: PadR family transcriptional regulator [Acidobacteriaceae bacterium]